MYMSENDVLDRQMGYIKPQIEAGVAPVVEGAGTIWKAATKKENPETGERAGALRILYDKIRRNAAMAIYRRSMIHVNRPRRRNQV
jgi:hypothetical protein